MEAVALNPEQLTQKQLKMIQRIFHSHPWHGVSCGAEAPTNVTVYIEIVPTDTFKFEIDKKSGFLRVDRPQKYSNICPQMYGFVPQTYCGDETASRCKSATGVEVKGDGDPLDICVLSERPVPRGNVLLTARPIGGFRMIDKGEADDKILAVLKGDAAYQNLNDISECPPAVIDRLRHYFLTYKLAPESQQNACQIPEIYGVDEAHAVIRASMNDYQARYATIYDAVQSTW